MGGYNYFKSCQRDVLVLDTESGELDNIAVEGNLEFVSKNNACAAVCPNKVLALVDSGGNKPKLIEYSMKQN